MPPHVPSVPLPFFAALHASHNPLQAVSQHTPSTQLLLAHCALRAQAVPSGSCAHDPVPLHTPAPAHSSSGSVPFATLPHVPSVPLPFLAAVQAWQAPAQAVLQHTPSTQLPLWHSELNVQAVPFASVVHKLVPLQTVAPEHSSSGSVPAAMRPHVPSVPLPFLAAVQARQVPVHNWSQHTPSTQSPLAQVAPVLQAVPSGSPTQTPLPLQTPEPVHSLSGSVPGLILKQKPSGTDVFAWVHAWQVPVHALLQHTPSTQLPLPH